MKTQDLQENVYNSMMQDVENQPEAEFLSDCEDFWLDDWKYTLEELKEVS